MAMLEVVYSEPEQLYFVVNTFDGVIIGRFYFRDHAETFALEQEPHERLRVADEYR
jgi:hypothetical protein